MCVYDCRAGRVLEIRIGKLGLSYFHFIQSLRLSVPSPSDEGRNACPHPSHRVTVRRK